MRCKLSVGVFDQAVQFALQTENKRGVGGVSMSREENGKKRISGGKHGKPGEAQARHEIECLSCSPS